MTFKPLSYLFVDLETTGLTDDDHLLEVAVIGADSDLNELFTYDSVVQPKQSTFDRLADNDVVWDMHSRNGLLTELTRHTGQLPTVTVVESKLCALVDEYSDASVTVCLAGGGVSHFDAHYLSAHMPALTKRMHYRSLDVSVIAQAWGDATGDDQLAKSGAKAHRASADIREDFEVCKKVWGLFRSHPDNGREALNGDEAVVAGLAVVSAFADAQESGGAEHRELADLLGSVRTIDALAGLTAVSAELVGYMVSRTGMSRDEVVAAVRRILTAA